MRLPDFTNPWTWFVIAMLLISLSVITGFSGLAVATVLFGLWSTASLIVCVVLMDRTNW